MLNPFLSLWRKQYSTVAEVDVTNMMKEWKCLLWFYIKSLAISHKWIERNSIL
jgi:hypothetical protein